jgi:hypothetical protein
MPLRMVRLLYALCGLFNYLTLFLYREAVDFFMAFYYDVQA